MRFRALTFDFFNTLVRHRDGRGRGGMLMEYLRSAGLESGPWEHQVLYDVFATDGDGYAAGLGLAEREEYLERFAERLFRRLGVRGGVARAHAAAIWELLGPTSLVPYPEVGEVLGALRRAGYRLAIVSNWPCGLGAFCRELGFGQLFEHVLASAEVGYAKPDARIFLEACRRLGVGPERVLHVGDTVAEDVEGARAAGVRPLLLARAEAPVQAGIEWVRDLTGVLRHLDVRDDRGNVAS